MKKSSSVSIAIILVLFTVFTLIVPGKSAASSFVDGEYSVPFVVLKDTGNEESATAEYMVSSAKVIVQNGKTSVVVTLNNSSWWQSFKVQSASGFTDVQVVSEDTVNNKRVVKFDVQDIEQLLNAKIHIIVTGIPGFVYDNKYDIRFKFTSTNIPLVPVIEKPATTPATNPSETENKIETKKETEKKTIPTKVESSTKEVEKEKEKTQTTVTEQIEETEEEVEMNSPEEIDLENESSEDTSDEPIEAEVESEEDLLEGIEEQVVESEVESTSNKNTTIIIIISVLLLCILAVFLIKKRLRK